MQLRTVQCLTGGALQKVSPAPEDLPPTHPRESAMRGGEPRVGRRLLDTPPKRLLGRESTGGALASSTTVWWNRLQSCE